MMEREKFMQEARMTARQILGAKENGIMNLVQQAWAEGKRNAEVETLRAAIDEALNRREIAKTMSSEAESCAEPVYLTEEREAQDVQREYEAAVEMAEYCERYEPTFNAEDGSM